MKISAQKVLEMIGNEKVTERYIVGSGSAPTIILGFGSYKSVSIYMSYKNDTGLSMHCPEIRDWLFDNLVNLDWRYCELDQ